MWRTVLQTREVQSPNWNDAFAQWLGTPADPFWWSTGSSSQRRDDEFEEFLANIEDVEIQVTVDTDVDLPDAVDYHWPWVALEPEKLETLPYLPENFDQLSFTLFKYSLRSFVKEMEENGKESRVILYWSPNGDYLD